MSNQINIFIWIVRIEFVIIIGVVNITYDPGPALQTRIHF